MSKDTEHMEFFAHFPQKVSQKIVDYATNTVLLSSRYIFTRRVGKHQYGYCTHCKQEYMTDGLKHNEDWECPKCKSLCIVKASGKGRKTLIDDAYFVWYEKSLVNPDAIVALGIYVIRDYTGDYYKTETMFKTAAMYLFEPGKEGKPGRSKMLRCSTYWSGYWGRGAGPQFENRWYKSKSIISEFDNSMKNKRCLLALESVVPAVHGTPFQYSTWSQYVDHSEDLVKFLDLAARYKCIEFLTKIGLHGIVNAKLSGMSTYGAINWNGQTPEKVLRLTKSEIKEMRKAGAIGPRALRSYQVSKQDGSNLNWEEARALSDLLESYHSDELRKLTKFAPVGKIKRYFAKQMRRENGTRYRTGSDVLTDWRDYLAECKELGMDLGQEHVLFPNNLHAAHQKTTEKVKIKADQALNALIAKRLKDLEKYTFEHGGFILRPAKDTIELFQEGKALNHCVGRYSKSYAEGKTNLFVIRKASDPNTPFYTMEIIDDKIIQTRGFKNCDPTDEVKAFIEAFKAEKLDKKPRKRKEITKITVVA